MPDYKYLSDIVFSQPRVWSAALGALPADTYWDIDAVADFPRGVRSRIYPVYEGIHQRLAEDTSDLYVDVALFTREEEE